MRPTFFLLVLCQTILLVNGEALQLNGLNSKVMKSSFYEIFSEYLYKAPGHVNLAIWSGR